MERKATVSGMRKGLGARLLLAAIGCLASMVTGVKGMYRPDHSTESRFKRFRIGSKNTRKTKLPGSKPMGRGRNRTVEYGNNLRNHFNQRPMKGRWS
jgi:hypothetical protein